MIDTTSPEMARIKTFLAQLRGLDDMLFGPDARPCFHDIGMALLHGKLIAHDLEYYMDEIFLEYERKVYNDVTLQDTARTPIPDYLKDL